jgi:hypothetical protein
MQTFGQPLCNVNNLIEIERVEIHRIEQSSIFYISIFSNGPVISTVYLCDFVNVSDNHL